MIKIKNTQRKFKINIDRIMNYTKKILVILNYSDFDLGIWFTNNRTIKFYNKEYRKKNKPTDILSFAYHNIKQDAKITKKIKIYSEEDKNLGDLIISLEYVDKDTKKLKINLEDRIKRLIIHGICHLIGYDHIEDKDWHKMRAKEGFLLKNIKSL